MSQNNVNYALNPRGPQLMDDFLAKEQENNLTSNSGVTRPSYAVEGTVWLDKSITPWLWKMYVGNDQDITIGDFNTTNYKFATLPATTDMRGTVQLATSTETVAGTDNTKAVTPSTLKSALDNIDISSVVFRNWES